METKKLAILAVGGNSLILDEKHKSVQDQYKAVVETVKHIVALMERNYRVVITHGNGPQVGFVLRRSELAKHELHEVPLDSCGADTQGAIGYQIQQAMYNETRNWSNQPTVATVITQTVVDKNDPSFQKPSKPIGSFMSEAEAKDHASREGWAVVEDAGRGYRRVVASPRPQRIVELEAINKLLSANIMVVAVGGGGIPVIENPDGSITGADAVIDKDLATSLLAQQLKADLLIISTAVSKVFINYKKPDEKALSVVTLAEAKQYLADGHFAAGSMKPKVEAIIEFLESGGQEAIITDPAHLVDAIEGRDGTKFVR